jgi:hypothetical protein
MVSGGVQKSGEVKPCPPNSDNMANRNGFSSEIYKKDGALRRKTPELALSGSVRFELARRGSPERLNSF